MLLVLQQFAFQLKTVSQNLNTKQRNGSHRWNPCDEPKDRKKPSHMVLYVLQTNTKNTNSFVIVPLPTGNKSNSSCRILRTNQISQCSRQKLKIGTLVNFKHLGVNYYYSPKVTVRLGKIRIGLIRYRPSNNTRVVFIPWNKFIQNCFVVWKYLISKWAAEEIFFSSTLHFKWIF